MEVSLAVELKRIGVKFMLMKQIKYGKDDYVIKIQDDKLVGNIVAFSPDKVVGTNLDYDEAVALIRILEGGNYHE